MSARDRMVWDCKDQVTQMICELVRADTKRTINDVAAAVDRLNRAWDELTDHLVRQRTVRDETIAHLHNVIAELRAEKGAKGDG